MIPDAAVEAAVNMLELLADMPPGETLARAVLEAAAPHMLEAAWESGWANARGNYIARYQHEPIPEWVTLRNPYGPTK